MQFLASCEVSCYYIRPSCYFSNGLSERGRDKSARLAVPRLFEYRAIIQFTQVSHGNRTELAAPGAISLQSFELPSVSKKSVQSSNVFHKMTTWGSCNTFYEMFTDYGLRCLKICITFKLNKVVENTEPVILHENPTARKGT